MAKTEKGEEIKRVLLGTIKRIHKLTGVISAELETMENLIEFVKINMPKENKDG